MEMFCIQNNYIINFNPTHYNDSGQTDGWQKEVYIYVKEFMKKNNFNKVIDVGCGSGFKLIKYLGEFDTTGIDTDPCYSMLVSKYPDRKWIKSGEPEKTFINKSLESDVVICSDVIEHIIDPVNLINFIKSIKSEYVIFSTPDREVLRTKKGYGERAWLGPPINTGHVREWTAHEFNLFISRYFRVITHFHCKIQKECMVFLCKSIQTPCEEQCA